ncbi:MAG: hypothetical protein IT459_08025 [Planctomycetes bacterium]|nr:hypothetical protein [Planctomycetota bacterium]
MPDGDDRGLVLHCTPMMIDATRAGRKRIATRMILSAYAGLHAERLVDPNAPDWHAQHDHENARELSGEYGVYPRGVGFLFDEVHEQHLRRLDRKSRKLVHELRHQIDRLARELLVRQTMTGDEVEAFLASQSL